MTRHWLAGAAAFAMMTGVALAQGTPTGTSAAAPSTAPAVGSSSAGAALSAPSAVGAAPANPNVSNYGTGGMQTPPGSPPASVTGVH
jgi:hypothetical protein